MTGILMKWGNLDTGTQTEKAPHDDRGRCQGDATVAKEHQRLPTSPQKLEESPGPDSPSTSREANAIDISVPDFYVPISAITQSVVPCYHSPSVSEFRLVLLTTLQAKNQERNCWRQGIAILLGKDSSQRTWQTSVPENHLS